MTSVLIKKENCGDAHIHGKEDEREKEKKKGFVMEK